MGLKKGGVPASFGRYGEQRHHFETAHSIWVAPTNFYTGFALPTAHSILPTTWSYEGHWSSGTLVVAAAQGKNDTAPRKAPRAVSLPC